MPPGPTTISAPPPLLPSPLAQFPALNSFLCWFVDADLDGESDAEVAARFAREELPVGRQRALSEGQALLTRADAELPWRDLGDVANRAFGDATEARAWLASMLAAVSAAEAIPKAAP